jgi:hypothetical protein
MSIVVWLISTAILWVVVVALTNATEAFVHNYAARVVAMICAGLMAGAAASAIGYTFFLLALLLFAKLMWVKRKLAYEDPHEREETELLASVLPPKEMLDFIRDVTALTGVIADRAKELGGPEEGRTELRLIRSPSLT